MLHSSTKHSMILDVLVVSMIISVKHSLEMVCLLKMIDKICDILSIILSKH
jgi:hypothetical protein